MTDEQLCDTVIISFHCCSFERSCSNDIFSIHKSAMMSEVLGLRPTKCVGNCQLKKRIIVPLLRFGWSLLGIEYSVFCIFNNSYFSGANVVKKDGNRDK